MIKISFIKSYVIAIPSFMRENILNFFQSSSLLNKESLSIVILLAVGLGIASLLGYFAWRIKLSPILGYLLAGYLIGPYSPGFVGNTKVSEQLAEIGVVLMMFGIGLKFNLKDLFRVKNVAIPGAIGQTFIASICGVLVFYLFGWPLQSGMIVGLAIGVASTVVLVHMLIDHDLLKTKEGHIAIGWLVVEDIITVIILVLLPNIAALVEGKDVSVSSFVISILVILAKFVILALLLVYLGRKVVSYLLKKIEKTNSHELFTLSVLALIFVVAIGTTFVFGVSIALGAFIAGMVIGQTDVRDKAHVHSMPMRDAFIAFFFLSVGMLFNPQIMVSHFSLFLAILAIILLIKPATAFLIAVGLKQPLKVAITCAIGLAQIGEFSFILSEEAFRWNLITDEGYDMIVACSLVSIALNPLLFKLICRKGVMDN